MARKLVNIMVCVMIASLMLASCTSSPSQGPTVSQAPTSAPTQAPSAAAETEPVAKFEPKTLKIMGKVDSELWDTRENQPVFKAFKEWLQKVNLTIEVEAIPKEQYTQVLQTRTAAALDLPDLINISDMDNATAVNLGKSGIFLDVKPLVEQYSNGNIKALQDQYFNNFWGPVVTSDGSTYWFPLWYKITYEKSKAFSSILTPLMRTDWMKTLGIKTPTTADEFIAALSAMQEQDANGNGKKDEVFQCSPSFFILGPLFGLPGDHFTVDVTDNKVKSPWLMKETLIPYIQFWQTLAEKSLLDIDSLDKPYEFAVQRIQSNMISAQVGYACTDWYSQNVKEYNGSYEGVIFKGGTGELYAQGELPEFQQGKMAITKACKDPEAAVRYFDVIATPEFAVLHRYGLEGDGHTYVDGVLTTDKKGYETEYALQGHAVGHNLWGGCLGSLAIEEWESLKHPYTQRTDDNAKVILYFGDQSSGAHKYYYKYGYQLAMENDTEITKTSEIYTDLSTYMDETLTKLCLGQYKIEDLDTYIAKMKELGLEDMMAIAQARHDRYIGK